MPTVTAPAKVLVTGANGFIAVWITRLLLEQGYAVRGTVRSAPKGDYVKNLFKSYGEKFQYTLVPNMTEDGAFDEAVKGVDAVLHTAAPTSFSGTPEEVINPVVQGTATILQSILRHGSKVRRVLFTSSVVTLLQPHEPGYVYTERDWNDFAVSEVEKKGAETPGYLVYCAAKVLSERAAWDFVKRHQEFIKWDFTTILPPRVIGPVLHETADSFLYSNLLEEKPADQVGATVGNWADVRDVALAHIRALQAEHVDGERFIVAAGTYSWQDVYDALASAGVADVPRGTPGLERPVRSRADPTKSTKAFGLTYRSLEESARDTVLSVRERLAAQ